jgi:hypothetical protein
MIDHIILLNKLSLYGINSTPLQWFSSYLLDRRQFVEIDGYQSKSDLIKTGVPQGSILGPLLFIIYINDIIHSSSLFNFIMYADDTTLVTSITPEMISNMGLNTIGRMINIELNKLMDWIHINKLSLNTSKTKCMIFHTRQRRLNNFIPKLSISGELIEHVSTFNFLGLTLDEHLTWNEHVNKISNKISREIGVLNKLKNYLPLSIMKLIYNSLIQSHLNYCNLIWGFNNDRIFKLQKKAIRTITRSKYNSHTEPIFKKLSILKLPDLFLINSLKFYFKYINAKLPAYFLQYNIAHIYQSHDHHTRNCRKFTVSTTRLDITKRCIRYNIPSVLNSFPDLVISKVTSHSYHGFVHYARNHIINCYQTDCLINDCYICNRV